MIVKCLKALQKYGLVSSAKFFSNQVKRRRFAKHHKNNSHTWNLAKKHFEIKNSTSEICVLLHPRLANTSTHFAKKTPVPKQETTVFENRRIPLCNHDWYTDILSGKKGDHASYFFDIDSLELDYDVKGVWEPSRFGHANLYAHAYKVTQSDVFAQYFAQDVTSWIEANSFLYGANWMNPMEVAIRAINWTCAFSYLHSSPTIRKDTQFLERFTRSLLDHAYFLENNWEIYLKNNNHLIADLLGFLYLCVFFKSIPSFAKKARESKAALLKEFFSQVHDDGTLYEGSTNYHKLVTEMFMHFRALCEQENMPLTSAFYVRLKKMLEFLEWSTDQGGNLVQIGDNDSGKIAFGLYVHPSQQTGIRHFAQFGLTILKTKDLHLSFRHPTYNPKQPSGHFHHDELAITLSWKGIPIFVDPGTGSYNANEAIRNNFRSSTKHNGPHIPTITDTFPSRFGLNRLIQNDTALIKEYEWGVMIKNNSSKYKNNGITLHRTLHCDYKKQSITIQDWTTSTCTQTHGLAWNFIVHPSIHLNAISAHEIEIQHEKERLALFRSSKEITIAAQTYSPHYASIVNTFALQCSSPFTETARFELLCEG